MGGYVVRTRVDGVRPRRRHRPAIAGRAPAAARRVGDVGHAMSWEERWARIRDAWAQMTFYLFDPDSWR